MTGINETTPLLGNGQPSQPPRRSPAILPAVLQLKTQELDSSCDWCPDDLSSSSEKAAFILTVLLRLKHDLLHRRNTPDDVWERWSQALEATQARTSLDERIMEHWTAFISVPRGSSEIAQVLWTDFPLSEDEWASSTRALAYVELFPVDLLRHPIVELSFLHTWRHGLRTDTPSNTGSTVRRVLRRFDAACTPRTSHLLELIWFVLYLTMIIHYTLAPPLELAEERVSAFTVIRTIIILGTSVSRLIQRWNISTIPFLFTALSFAIALPTIPRSPGLSYDTLLFALALHIIQLHLPYPPGPLFLLPFEQTLPLVTTLWTGFAKVYIPCLLLFLPASALVLFLLSYSLENANLDFTTLAAPMDARTMFLSLLGIFLVLLLCSLAMLILIFPGMSTHPPPPVWDRYTLNIGLQARIILARTLTSYSSPYYFPAPLNIVQQMFVEIPYFFLRILGSEQKVDQKTTLERWLWRVFVGLPAVAVTGALALLDRLSF